MAKRKSRKSWFVRNRTLIIVVALLLLAGGAWVLKAYNKPDKTDNTASDGSYINLSPATNEEKQETEAHKNELSQPPSSTPTANGKKQITPIITSATQDQISAYVAGIFEDGGICTATLTKGSKTVTKTSEGFRNVSYTSCAPINISGSVTEKGTWNVIVSYDSATAQGTSTPTTLEVKQ